MKPALIFAVALFAAVTAMASTTTCAVLDESPQPDGRIRFLFLYTFYTGEVTQTRPLLPGGTDGQTACDAGIPGQDAMRTEQALLAFFSEMVGNLEPELLQPAFPEDCVPVAPAVTVEDCRRAAAHQFVLRNVWPLDATGVRDHFYELYDWINKPAGQGGSGYNTTEKRAWLDITASQLNAVDSRLSNVGAIVSALDIDEQNWEGRELESF